MPLTGPVSAEWIHCYQRLALAADVPARAEQSPAGARLVVRVPANCSGAEVAETMDAAGLLLSEGDTSTARAQAGAGTTEAAIRDWWRLTSQPGTRAAAPRREIVRTGIGADRRWSIAAALLIAVAVQLLLPARFSLGPNWIFSWMAVAPPGWRPAFPDYLYLGFTNATAFSPTDVMPLARWGKLAMTVQSIASLAILGLVIARAVNIFS